MKKILAMLLVLAACAALVCFPSCATLDTTGLLDAAPDLIRRSLFFNDVYYGDGIPYDTEAGPVIGHYYAADPAFLSEHGFRTLDELKARTAEVFSATYSGILFNAVKGFAAEGEGGSYVYARYSSNQAEGQRDENETILVLDEPGTFSVGVIEYDFSTIRLGDVTAEWAEVVITAAVPNPSTPDHVEPTVTEDVTVRFVYEGGWKIDSPTY